VKPALQGKIEQRKKNVPRQRQNKGKIGTEPKGADTSLTSNKKKEATVRLEA